MSEQEIAECLGVTGRTVRRDWEKARSLLSARCRRLRWRPHPKRESTVVR